MLSIRKTVFGLETQEEFAELAGVTQGTVSKWETGQGEPSRETRSRIKAAAEARGLRLEWGWFLEAPAQPAAQ